MRVLRTVAVLVGALALASTAVAADLELGKKTYGSKCVSCHGADGKGNAKLAERMKMTIPDLGPAGSKGDAELLKVVADGKRPMPGFGKSLSQAELEAVVAYVKALASGKAAGK
jgi:cytochrome c6